MISITLISGLALLAFGGDVLVRGAIGIAHYLKVSTAVTGLVIVGFGTSTPELVASVDAALQGAPGIAIGNVVGSNIANIFLILGLTAMIFPIAANFRSLNRDGPMLLIATGLCSLFLLSGGINRFVGLGFIICLGAYLLYTIMIERRHFDAQAQLHAEEVKLVDAAPKSLGMSSILAVIGIGLLIIGANLTISSAVEVATLIGISELVVGLTVVAVGTSLPELASSVVAAFRRQADIAVGNIIGSNIFNILGILGITAIVKPLKQSGSSLGVDVAVMILSASMLIAVLGVMHRINRPTGIFLFALYGGYMAWLAIRSTPI